MLGCSENAVKTHLRIAICAYLILAKVKALYDSPYSIKEIGTLTKVYALAKTDPENSCDNSTATHSKSGFQRTNFI